MQPWSNLEPLQMRACFPPPAFTRRLQPHALRLARPKPTKQPSCAPSESPVPPFPPRCSKLCRCGTYTAAVWEGRGRAGGCAAGGGAGSLRAAARRNLLVRNRPGRRGRGVPPGRAGQQSSPGAYGGGGRCAALGTQSLSTACAHIRLCLQATWTALAALAWLSPRCGHN
jgi:hypothetical protein